MWYVLRLGMRGGAYSKVCGSLCSVWGGMYVVPIVMGPCCVSNAIASISVWKLSCSLYEYGV